MSSNPKETPSKKDKFDSLLDFKDHLEFIFKEAKIKKLQDEKKKFMEEFEHQEALTEILKHHSLNEGLFVFFEKHPPFTTKKAWLLLENNIRLHTQEEVIKSMEMINQYSNKDSSNWKDWMFHLEKNGIHDAWSPFVSIMYQWIKELSLEKTPYEFARNYRNILLSSLHKKQWKSVDALLHPSFLEEQETIDMIFDEDPVMMCFKAIVKQMPSSDIERFVQDHITLNRAFRKYCHDKDMMHWVDFKTSCIQKEILHNQMQPTQTAHHIPKRL